MTDVFDRGQEREQEMRDDALADFKRLHPASEAASALFCHWCDEPIPDGRRRAVPGVQTCIECQTDVEKQGRSDWGMAE